MRTSTRHLNRIAAAALAIAGLSACADEVDESVTQPVEQAVEQVEDGVEAIDQAGDLACNADRGTLELAVEAFTALQGHPPESDADLVQAGLLREESSLYDIAADGTIVAANGSGCR